jgi:hypothetical protein
MSRALPLLLAATITAGVTGAALIPTNDEDAPGVVAMADAGPTLVSPLDWTTAGMAVGHDVALNKAADARAAKAAAEERARKARALEAQRRASRARRAAVSYGSPRAIAQSMLAARGWSSQWGCLDSLWQRESGWRVYASNPSGAYGIPQALPGRKMASAGSDWRTNPATQIRWGLGYIAASYGGPCAAWRHSQNTGWY